jgi:hypothetical protein
MKNNPTLPQWAWHPYCLVRWLYGKPGYRAEWGRWHISDYYSVQHKSYVVCKLLDKMRIEPAGRSIDYHLVSVNTWPHSVVLVWNHLESPTTSIGLYVSGTGGRGCVEWPNDMFLYMLCCEIMVETSITTLEHETAFVADLTYVVIVHNMTVIITVLHQACRVCEHIPRQTQRSFFWTRRSVVDGREPAVLVWQFWSMTFPQQLQVWTTAQHYPAGVSMTHSYLWLIGLV